MLALKPDERLTMEQIKNHPWVNVKVPDLEEKVQDEYFRRAEKLKKNMTKETHGRSLNIETGMVMRGMKCAGSDESGEVFTGKDGTPSKMLNYFIGVCSMRTIINSCNPDTSEEGLV